MKRHSSSGGEFDIQSSETFDVQIDPALQREVLDCYIRLNITPCGGFMNPDCIPVDSAEAGSLMTRLEPSRENREQWAGK